jgi:hypothetical protein
MSKSNELDRVVKLYLLSCIDNEGFEDCEYYREFKTNQDKIDFLKGRFYSEHGFLVERIGQQKAVHEWLSGLAIDIVFYNHEIIELAIEWGSLTENSTEYQKDKILDNYWNFMAAKLCQLFNGYRLPKEDINL